MREIDIEVYDVDQIHVEMDGGAVLLTAVGSHGRERISVIGHFSHENAAVVHVDFGDVTAVPEAAANGSLYCRQKVRCWPTTNEPFRLKCQSGGWGDNVANYVDVMCGDRMVAGLYLTKECTWKFTSGLNPANDLEGFEFHYNNRRGPYTE
jgi:hypothetical protein